MFFVMSVHLPGQNAKCSFDQRESSALGDALLYLSFLVTQVTASFSYAKNSVLEMLGKGLTGFRCFGTPISQSRLRENALFTHQRVSCRP